MKKAPGQAEGCVWGVGLGLRGAGRVVFVPKGLCGRKIIRAIAKALKQRLESDGRPRK
jgi:hypothetical protein